MKIAIAGYGIEGKQNYQYFTQKYPDANIVIADERAVTDAPDGVDVLSGEGVFGQLDDFDMVVRTAGLAPRKITTNGKIWSATNEFFAKCPAPIIGVTGTKGKGTTSSFIAEILRAAGKTVHLVGNIGQPGLEVLASIVPEDIVVYELSSFQLWDIERSPHVAVVLPIEPDHLDVHADFEEYLDAKQSIVRFQTAEDTVVYCADNTYAKDIAESSASYDKRFYPYETPLVESVVLPGRHNQENAMAAISAVKEWVNDYSTIREGLGAFHGLPHRLKFVAEKNGVKFYDDSIGTTPGSSLAALAAFTEPKVLILGGSDKGADYTKIVETCHRTNTKVVAIGQTGEGIAELCHKLGVVVERVRGDMSEVVARADEMAHSGDIVILSPASASFDQYKNYADRGDQFIAAVNQLAD